MNLTDEQKIIINTNEDIKINAVAGSGKTTTIIEYAKSRPKTSKILYLAFNKSVKNEATVKFEKENLSNVKVATAHSLAYGYIVPKYKYKITMGHTPSSIMELLKLPSGKATKDSLAIAYHANNLLSAYCNSSVDKIKDFDYSSISYEIEDSSFVQKNISKIIDASSQLYENMEMGKIDVTHDFYLKKFQLEKRDLLYDYILFDEGQDASGAMLDVFLNQNSKKIIVGDTHQQIYSWRYAINSLEQVEYPTFNLTNSFRFPEKIAKMAIASLKYKSILGNNINAVINGVGDGKGNGIPASLSRSNVSLLRLAIESAVVRNTVKKVYFEGGSQSYMWSNDGCSIYDIYNLFMNKPQYIRDPLVKSMKSITELSEYAKITGDFSITSMIEITGMYRSNLPNYLKILKSKTLDENKRNEADMIYSSVHKSKGMEYPRVTLANDFITKKRIRFILEQFPGKYFNSKLNEEINILYVAITRAMNELVIPDEINPLRQ